MHRALARARSTRGPAGLHRYGAASLHGVALDLSGAVGTWAPEFGGRTWVPKVRSWPSQNGVFVSRGKGKVSVHPVSMESTSSFFSGGGKPILHPPNSWSPGRDWCTTCRPRTRCTERAAATMCVAPFLTFPFVARVAVREGSHVAVFLARRWLRPGRGHLADRCRSLTQHALLVNWPPS